MGLAPRKANAGRHVIRLPKRGDPLGGWEVAPGRGPMSEEGRAKRRATQEVLAATANAQFSASKRPRKPRASNRDEPKVNTKKVVVREATPEELERFGHKG